MILNTSSTGEFRLLKLKNLVAKYRTCYATTKLLKFSSDLAKEVKKADVLSLNLAAEPLNDGSAVFEPALIVKTKKENLKLLEVFENTQGDALFEVLVDETKEECQQKLSYSCSVWSLQIDESPFLDYGTSAKQVQETSDRINIFSKVLIAVVIIGAFALALYKVKLNKTK